MPTVTLPTTLATSGYVPHSGLSGSLSLAADGAIHLLDLAADATVTLTGGGTGGPSVSFHVKLNGHALTIAGVAITSDGLTAVYRADSAWQVVTSGSSSGGGDTTAPTAGTLTVPSTTATTANLSVSGAADETALHASPYSFSKDNGLTWSGYQSGSTYSFTGLTASTSYTFRHRVRDAAGNVKVGTAVTASTGSGSASWQTFATDTFTDADGTALTSHQASNGTTWSLPASGVTPLTIASNKAIGPGGSASRSRLSLGSNHTGGVRLSAVLDGGQYPSLLIGYNSPNYSTGANVSGGIELSPSGGTYTMAGKGAASGDTVTLTPDSGKSLSGHAYGSTFTIEMATDGSFKVSVNGTQIGTGALPGTLAGQQIELAAYGAASFDNLLVEIYQ